MKKSLLIVISILIGIIFFQRIFQRQPIVPISPKVDTVYRVKDSLIYIPKDSLIYRDTGSVKLIRDTISIPIPTDTLAILLDYSRKRLYNDTIINDSLLLVVTQDTVQYNRITGRKKVVHYFITHVREPVKLHNQIFLGFGAGYNIDKFGFSGKVLLVNKRDQIYGLSFDPINKQWELSMYWKLSFRKRRKWP